MIYGKHVQIVANRGKYKSGPSCSKNGLDNLYISYSELTQD